jgi:hypothetical protein
VLAAKNPLDERHMVLVFAGNDPLTTAEALDAGYGPTPAVVLEDGKPLEGSRRNARSR